MQEIYKDADTGGDGLVDKAELYTMVLRMYLFVAQYTIVAIQTVPSRKDVDSLYDIMDTVSDVCVYVCVCVCVCVCV